MVLRKLYKNRGKVILIVAAVLFYLFSPYRIQISHGDAPYKQLFSTGSTESGVSYSDLNAFTVKLDESYEVPEFIPIDFDPQNGAQEHSYSLYKKARIVNKEDVIVNLNKVSWSDFNIKGLSINIKSLWYLMYTFQDISIKEDCLVGKMHTRQVGSIKESLMMFQWIEISQILD